MKDKNTEIREAIDAGNRALSALEEARQRVWEAVQQLQFLQGA